MLPGSFSVSYRGRIKKECLFPGGGSLFGTFFVTFLGSNATNGINGMDSADKKVALSSRHGKQKGTHQKGE